MRWIYKAVVLTGALVVLAALNASPASAVIEVEDAITGEHCNPCEIHLVGESHLTSTTFGVEVSTCSDELDGEIYSDGTAEFEWTESAHGAPGCNVGNCTASPGDAHWPVHSGDETAPDTVTLNLEACLRATASGAEIFCDPDVTVTEPGLHDYELELSEICSNGTWRYEASWDIEGQPIEIDHTPGETPIELDEEATGEPCAPCLVHLDGESHVVAQLTGLQISTCADELDATLLHDGTGEMEWTGNAHGGVGCNTSNCTAQPNADHWPLTEFEETDPSAAHVTATICLRGTSGLEITCEGEIDVTEPESHSYSLTTVQLCADDAYRFEGAWETEDSTLEIDHTPDPPPGPGPVEIVDEASGDPCNPCEVHLVGESHWTALPSGVEILTCSDELEGLIYHDGTGELEWIGVAHGGPGCFAGNCTITPGARHWPIHFAEETAPDTVEIQLEMCFQSTTTELYCAASPTVTETAPHSYRLTIVQVCAGGARRFEAVWDTEGDPVELVHL